MVDIHADTKDGGYCWVAVLIGRGRRRRWSDEAKARRRWSDKAKARIVAETLEPGAVVAEVARRWQLSSQQVFTWRREMRGGASTPLSFVLIVADKTDASGDAVVRSTAPSPLIEAMLAGAVLRVVPGTDEALLTAVLRARRASAT